MSKRNLTLSRLTETDLNIVLGLIDDLTQNLDTKGRLAVTAILSGALSLKDADLTIVDDVDGSKRFQFQASGITTGTQRTLTIPDANTTLVGTDATQTLSNKTINNTNTIAVKDANLTVQDDADTTRRFQFQASTVTAGATRVFSVPDADTTLVGTATAQTLSNKTIDNTNTIVVKDASFTLQDDGNAARQAQFQLSGLSAVTRTLTIEDADYTLAGRNITETSTQVGIGGTPTAKLDVVGYIRSNSNASAPSSGAGAELVYAAPNGGIAVFDRTGAVFKPMYVSGSTVVLNRSGLGGAGDLTIDASGNTTLAGTLAGTSAAFTFEALTNQTAPSTPAAGKLNIWSDSTAKILVYTDDAGVHHAQTINSAIASQSPAAATDVYITNSDILIPSFSVQAKTQILWRLSVSKTAAGVVAPQYNIRIGTNKSTADTARLTISGPVQTAIADIGTLNIMVTVRNISATVGVIQGTAWWDHRGTAASSTIGAGFANDGTGHVEGTSAGFANNALGGSSIGLSINTGTSAAWTITQVQGEAIWG